MNGLMKQEALQAVAMQGQPRRTFKIDGQEVSLSLASSEHGFDDFDVTGHSSVRRICVPHTVKRGDRVNVYYGDSSKEGALWKGSAEETVIGFVKVAGTRLDPTRKRYVCSKCNAGGADTRKPEVCHGCKAVGTFVLAT